VLSTTLTHLLPQDGTQLGRIKVASNQLRMYTAFPPTDSIVRQAIDLPSGSRDKGLGKLLTSLPALAGSLTSIGHKVKLVEESGIEVRKSILRFAKNKWENSQKRKKEAERVAFDPKGVNMPTDLDVSAMYAVGIIIVPNFAIAGADHLVRVVFGDGAHMKGKAAGATQRTCARTLAPIGDRALRIARLILGLSHCLQQPYAPCECACGPARVCT